MELTFCFAAITAKYKCKIPARVMSTREEGGRLAIGVANRADVVVENLLFVQLGVTRQQQGDHLLQSRVLVRRHVGVFSHLELLVGTRRRVTTLTAVLGTL